MTEPAEEQPDPRSIVKPTPHESGGRQDDSQNPFEPQHYATAETPKPIKHADQTN